MSSTGAKSGRPAPSAGSLPDPRQAAMVAAYRRIHQERMRGLPIVNESLDVETVAFAEWDGRPLGILITPWCMNLVLMPAAGEDWSGLVSGEKRTWDMPSGSYEFIATRTEGIGPFQSCALFTTVNDFPDQATARAVAGEIMATLLLAGGSPEPAPAPAHERTRTALRPQLSRRALFRRLAGGQGDDGKSHQK